MILSVTYFRKASLVLLTFAFLMAGIISCNKKDYPCPGLGKSDEADLSMFDENGKLKDEKNKGRINKSSGLVNKKKPKKLQAQRKTRL
jgi:hypothetical protein